MQNTQKFCFIDKFKNIASQPSTVYIYLKVFVEAGVQEVKELKKKASETKKTKPRIDTPLGEIELTPTRVLSWPSIGLITSFKTQNNCLKEVFLPFTFNRLKKGGGA